jgi:hypothetical protein
LADPAGRLKKTTAGASQRAAVKIHQLNETAAGTPAADENQILVFFSGNRHEARYQGVGVTNNGTH